MDDSKSPFFIYSKGQGRGMVENVIARIAAMEVCVFFCNFPQPLQSLEGEIQMFLQASSSHYKAKNSDLNPCPVCNHKNGSGFQTLCLVLWRLGEPCRGSYQVSLAGTEPLPCKHSALIQKPLHIWWNPKLLQSPVEVLLRPRKVVQSLHWSQKMF